jgi:3-isopropylmalate/(R)-2-methylmalate dehydratase small subunit
MVRGTFANIRLRNRLAPGTEGGVTTYLPTGEVMPIFDAGMKYQESGTPTIILAGKEYGSGSSREHAVWALMEFGIRAVVAESFAPIFFGNCVRNGLLPAAVPGEAVLEIAACLAEHPGACLLTVDLPSQVVKLPDGRQWPFPISGEAKAMLLEGLDAIDLTLKHQARIDAFIAEDRGARPWIYLGERA